MQSQTLAIVHAHQHKTFIIGLPRTGTTSVCAFLLNCGFKVAHNAFSQKVFDLADVVADTPVYVDYSKLDKRFPNSRFIYLDRDLDQWLPSIRRLLKSMRKKHLNDPSFFHSDVMRCFTSVFPDFLLKHDYKNDYLCTAYSEHKYAVLQYFKACPENFCSIEVASANVGKRILSFLGCEETRYFNVRVPHLNQGRRITYWEDIEHINKIASQ